MITPLFQDIVSPGFQSLFWGPQLSQLKQDYDESGILVFNDFITKSYLDIICAEALQVEQDAFRTESKYNIYVKPNDPTLSPYNPRNRIFSTQKGCICDDQIGVANPLKVIYNDQSFRDFIAYIVGAEKLYPYADTLSSININYYKPGDSLERHFDNADFTITFLVQNPKTGGMYQYFPNMRYDINGNEDFNLTRAMIDGVMQPVTLNPGTGSLMLFRGNNSLHRVTPIEEGTRILVTFNFNRSEGVSLSETSRMTFFGREK